MRTETELRVKFRLPLDRPKRFFPNCYYPGKGGLMAKRVEINTMAPDFSLPDFTGREVSLSDYRTRMHGVLVFNRGFA